METKGQAITGLKKRQQIQNANKAVFIWVTVAAVIVAIAVVMMQFLGRQFIFNTKIITAMSATNATIQKNIANYEPLKLEVSKLLSNAELTRLRADPSVDSALQTVIDAMPTVDDRVALAASLQQKVLSKSGVTVESLATTNGAETSTAVVSTSTTSDAVEVPFSFKVSGTYLQVQQMFVDLQNSIRPISVKAVDISGGTSRLSVDVQAVTYFATPKTTKLSDGKVTP